MPPLSLFQGHQLRLRHTSAMVHFGFCALSSPDSVSVSSNLTSHPLSLPHHHMSRIHCSSTAQLTVIKTGAGEPEFSLLLPYRSSLVTRLAAVRNCAANTDPCEKTSSHTKAQRERGENKQTPNFKLKLLTQISTNESEISSIDA